MRWCCQLCKDDTDHIEATGGKKGEVLIMLLWWQQKRQLVENKHFCLNRKQWTRTSAHATTFFYILLLRELSCDGWFEFGFSKVYIQFRQEGMQLWVWSSDEKINDSKFFKIHTCMTNHSYNNHFLSLFFLVNFLWFFFILYLCILSAKKKKKFMLR